MQGRSAATAYRLRRLYPDLFPRPFWFEWKLDLPKGFRPGRPTKYASNADRQAAYRERRK